MTDFLIVNGVTVINGNKGPYDNSISNPSVKYGRNALANFFRTYSTKPLTEDKFEFSSAKGADFDKQMAANEALAAKLKEQSENMPVPDFEYQYMPQKANSTNFDKMALMAAAYEELGQNTEIPLEELNNKVQSAFGDKVSADALDLDGDKKVDIAEYSTGILLEDILSKDSSNPNITGVINKKGQLKALSSLTSENQTRTNNALKTMHKIFELNTAKKEFESDSNNLLKLDIMA